MDWWKDGRTGGPMRGSRIFCRGGGGGGGVKAQRPEYRIRTCDQYTHARTQRGTWMFMHRQTDRHTASKYIDGKLKDIQITRNMHNHVQRYIRNIHARACRCIHAIVSLSLNFRWKWNNLVPSRPNYFMGPNHFIFIGYLKTGGMELVRANPLNSNWIRHCFLYMYAKTFWLHHTWASNSYVLQKYMGRVVLWIWAELSYKLGPSWHGPSFMWAELAWAQLVMGRVVRNSTVAGREFQSLTVFGKKLFR